MMEPLRILILEDNPADAELVQFELQEAGFAFTPKVVMTEEDFIREIQEFCPNLILSDYDLPKYNGALALAEARRRCPDTPFILVTGAVTEDRAIEILTQGAKDYVLKNRLQQRLVPAVRRALEEAKEHRERKQAEAELREAHRTLEERVKSRTAELGAEITARKKTQEALQDSEKRYRRLFESAKDGILILDANTGKVDDVNPILLQLLGYSYDALCGKYIWELGVFKDIIASRDAFKVLQENEYIRYDDLPLETLAGHAIAVEFISNVYLVDHHKVVQCNIRDITERKQMEEEKKQLLNDLRKEKDRLQALINGIGDEIWFADNQKRFTLANPSALKEFGLNSDAGSIDIRKFADNLEVYRPDGSPRPFEEAPALRALEGEVVRNQEEMIRTPATGEIRYRQVSSNPVRNASGQIIGSVSVVRDITQIKQAEEWLKLHAAIMETVAEGIFLIGLEDNIIKWTNRKFDQLFGYDPGELVGMHVDKVNAPTERTPTETRISIVDVLRQAGEWHGEIENIKKDGTHFWCYIHVSLFNHPEFGTVMVSAHTDITERKTLQECLQRS